MLSLSYCCFLIVCGLSFTLTCAEEAIDPEWDLPTYKELSKYLGAVENVVDFCTKSDEQMEVSLAFGLFLANTHLDHAMLKKQKTLPENIRHKMKNIIEDINKILDGLITKVSINENKEIYDKKKSLISLFSNVSYWAESIENFSYTVEKHFTPDQLAEIYSPFPLYIKEVGNVDEGYPNPVLSDACLISLSKNPKNEKQSPTQCSVDDVCYDMLKRGTNFGYFLTHRILFLLMARFGRGCSVFSEDTDRAMLKEFCSMAHAEATYIAEHHYALADLFAEIIIVCTVDAHSQFIPRTWLDNILKFQRPDGCFGIVPVEKTAEGFFKAEVGQNQKFLQQGCRAHITGLVVAAFSASVRFIIEEYY